MFDEQDTVDVVVLVLDNAGIHTGESLLVRLKIFIQPAQVQGWLALYVAPYVRNAQTAFFVCPGRAAFFYFVRIDENPLDAFRFLAFVHDLYSVNHKQADGEAHLRCGKSHTTGIVHGFPHVFDQDWQVGIILRNVGSYLLEYGLTVSVYWQNHVDNQLFLYRVFSKYSCKMSTALILSTSALSRRFFFLAPLCKIILFASSEVNRSS